MFRNYAKYLCVNKKTIFSLKTKPSCYLKLKAGAFFDCFCFLNDSKKKKKNLNKSNKKLIKYNFVLKYFAKSHIYCKFL